MTFELSGGDVCLDFANTLSHRRLERPVEWLAGFGDLVAWARQVGVVSDADARRLASQAAGSPGRAAAFVRCAVALRDGIFAIMSAVAHRRPPPAPAFARLNREVAATFARSAISASAAGFSWSWRGRTAAPERILWAVVRAAADLLRSPGTRERLRECAGAECAWLFVDTSRNGRRRWCDMRVCGNRAKVRRFRARRGPVRGRFQRRRSRSPGSSRPKP